MKTTMRVLILTLLVTASISADIISSSTTIERGSSPGVQVSNQGFATGFTCSATANPNSLDQPLCFPLLTELKETEIGQVCLELVGNENLRLVYQTSGSWTLLTTWIWGSRDRTDYPMSHGSPDVNRFPFKGITPIGATRWETTIALDDVVICSPDAYEGDVTSYVIASAEVENLFDFSGPRRREVVHAHQHWLSMTNEKSGDSRYFSFLEFDFDDVECDCVVEDTTKKGIFALGVVGGDRNSQEDENDQNDQTITSAPEAVQTPTPEAVQTPEISTRTNDNTKSDSSPTLAPTLAPSESAKESNLIEATEVVVGTTFTVVHHTDDDDIESLVSVLNTAFGSFVKEVMDKHKISSTPALRRRKLATDLVEVAVELDPESPTVYHYMTPRRCPSTVTAPDAVCYDGVGRFTLLIEDFRSMAGICSSFTDFTTDMFDTGAFQGTLKDLMLRSKLNFYVQDTTVDYCGTAADHAQTKRFVPPLASSVEVEETSEGASGSTPIVAGAAVFSLVIILVLVCYFRGKSGGKDMEFDKTQRTITFQEAMQEEPELMHDVTLA